MNVVSCALCSRTGLSSGDKFYVCPDCTPMYLTSTLISCEIQAIRKCVDSIYHELERTENHAEETNKKNDFGIPHKHPNEFAGRF